MAGPSDRRLDTLINDSVTDFLATQGLDDLHSDDEIPIPTQWRNASPVPETPPSPASERGARDSLDGPEARIQFEEQGAGRDQHQESGELEGDGPTLRSEHSAQLAEAFSQREQEQLVQGGPPIEGGRLPEWAVVVDERGALQEGDLEEPAIAGDDPDSPVALLPLAQWTRAPRRALHRQLPPEREAQTGNFFTEGAARGGAARGVQHQQRDEASVLEAELAVPVAEAAVLTQYSQGFLEEVHNLTQAAVTEGAQRSAADAPVNQQPSEPQSEDWRERAAANRRKALQLRTQVNFRNALRRLATKGDVKARTELNRLQALDRREQILRERRQSQAPQLARSGG